MWKALPCVQNGGDVLTSLKHFTPRLRPLTYTRGHPPSRAVGAPRSGAVGAAERRAQRAEGARA